MRRVLKLSFFLVVIFCGVSVVFVWLYLIQKKVDLDVTRRLTRAEETIKELENNKEMLMARLVLSGNLPVEDQTVAGSRAGGVAGEMEAAPSGAGKIEKQEDLKPDSPAPSREINTGEETKDQVAEDGASGGAAVSDSGEATTGTKDGSASIKTKAMKVGIEDLKLTCDGATRDLLVRFNIRNLNDAQKNISGYIFVVLKPDPSAHGEALVIPASSMENHRPSQPKRGQYFSIAHFKPVRFRNKDRSKQALYKSATVFVFTEKSELIFEKEFHLAGENGCI